MALDLSGLSRLTKEYGIGEIKRNELLELAISSIQPDPNQPRKEFDESALNELTESIREFGLIQPIAVQFNAECNNYWIISGERRYRAAKAAGLSKIKAVVMDNVKEENIGYLQMAENMKRSDLTVAEIAEFICSRIALGEKQTDIADKLGLDKGQISKYSAWKEMPEFLKEAVKTKKLGSIQAAHALLKAWEEYPKETEEFLLSKEKISTTEAKKFDPKSWYVPTLSDEFNNGDSVQEQTTESENSRTDVLETGDQTEDHPSEDGDSNSEEYADGLSVSSYHNETEEAGSNLQNAETISEGMWDSDEGNESGNLIEGVQNNNLEKSVFGELQNNESDDVESKTGEFFDTNGSAETLLRKPIIFCFVQERECELLYRKKTPEGIVCVKYEDGTEGEVTAEKVLLNRICEA